MGERTARVRFCYFAAAALSVSALLLAPSVRVPRPTPHRLPQLATWVSTHPSDWVALMWVTQQALESEAKQPIALWHAAYAAASAAAPYRPAIRSSFVSSGLFHWNELGSFDRRAILDNAAPLLAQPDVFDNVAGPLFQLTGDLDFLRRHAPRAPAAIEQLESLAASAARFDAYRQLRGQLDRVRLEQFGSERATRSPAELLALLPPVIHHEDEALLRGILDELHRRPLDHDPGLPHQMDALIDYVLGHDLGPLDGIEVLAGISGSASDPARARLALATGNLDEAARIEATSLEGNHSAWTAYYLARAAFERRHQNHDVAALYAAKASASRDDPVSWRGLCASNEICTSAFGEIMSLEQTRHASLTLEPASGAAPYVEIYVDGNRIHDGEIASTRAFDLDLEAPAVHSVEIRIVDPFTPDGRQRSLRILRLVP